MMQRAIPSQCPECSEIAVSVASVPPEGHDCGDGWATRAECDSCGAFIGWFD